MFGKRFDLFEIFGFKIRIDLSWFVIAVLVTWSLAAQPYGWFPTQHPELSTAVYWTMGVAGALGLFASIVVHELAHALMARRFDLPMRGITLFIFGGVAEMTDEPPSPTAEFMVAVAGPIASVAIAGVAFGGRLLGAALDWSLSVVAVLGYLALINIVLVVFNAIPAFPLDGGRVLRSILWQWKGSLRWASRISSRIGSGFGIALIAFGIFFFIRGDFIGGIWWCLIGLFVRNAARMSYQQVLVRQTLEGEPVSRFMKSDPVTVPRSISVQKLVDDYVYRYHYKMFPVTEDGRLLGCVTTQHIKELPREEWERQSVSAIMEPCSSENTVAPDSDAMEALSLMSRTKSSRLLVAEGEQVEGIITLKDMLEFLSLKVDLGDERALPTGDRDLGAR